jgi:hypothetical protein
VIASHEVHRPSPSCAFLSGSQYFATDFGHLDFRADVHLLRSCNIHKNKAAVPRSQIAATAVKIVLFIPDLSAPFFS